MGKKKTRQSSWPWGKDKEEEEESSTDWDSMFVGSPPSPPASGGWKAPPQGGWGPTTSWKKSPEPWAQRPKPKPKARSAGGVVIDHRGRVLLRQPANFFGGYHWNFPKGRLDPGEDAPRAAAREIWEETGYRVKSVLKLPGEFHGTTTITSYYLMIPLRKDFKIVPGIPEGEPGWESQAIKWAGLSQAVKLLQENPKHLRLRDMTVLALGYGEWLKNRRKLQKHYGRAARRLRSR